MVTWASSGIGNATARALAAEGATVALLARRREKLDDLARDLGEGAAVHEVDVTDADAVREVIEAVAHDHGRIDVLVNNAGYGTMDPALEADLGEWQKMVDVNLTGVQQRVRGHQARGQRLLRGAAPGARAAARPGRPRRARPGGHELTNTGRDNAPDASAASELGVLEASDIAEAIVYMVTRPPRTAVNEVLIRPTEQTR